MVYFASQGSCARAIGCERFLKDMASEWQVETLRITVFPVDNENVSPSELWSKHFGATEPEVHIEPGSRNQRNAEYGNGDIYLIKTPSQIDWRYVLPPDTATYENNMPVWGDLDFELTSFVDFSKSFLQNPAVLPVSRLAFGAVLMETTLNANSTHRHLKRYLPKLDLEDSADFGYTISRRRTSEVVNDLLINRLNRWHVATLNRNTSTLDPAADAEEHRLERFFAARLELDINTVPLVDECKLNSTLLPDLFDELVRMGLEIASKGDVP